MRHTYQYAIDGLFAKASYLDTHFNSIMEDEDEEGDSPEVI
jgi:hypothetical protein